MRVGSLILTLWWMFTGLVLGAAANYHFRDGDTWWGVLDLLACFVAFTFFLREAPRIDRD